MITFAEVKQFCNASDAQQQDANFYIAVALQEAKNLTRRELEEAAYTDALVYAENKTILLPNYPVKKGAALSVKKRNGEEVAVSLVWHESGIVTLDSKVDDWVKVSYTAGYAAGAVPADLKSALLEIVSWLFSRRSQVGIRSMKTEYGGETALELTIPFNARRILNRYRRD